MLICLPFLLFRLLILYSMYEDHIGIKCTFVCFNVFILGNIIHMLILYLLLLLNYVLIIIYIYNLY